MPKKLIFELHLLGANLKIQELERLRVTLETPEICAEEWPHIQKKLQKRLEKRGWCQCKVLYSHETRGESQLLEFGDLRCLKQLLGSLDEEALLRDTVELPLYVVPDPTDGPSVAMDGKDVVFESDQQSGLKLSLRVDILLGKGGFGHVLRARDRETGSEYALKISFPDKNAQISMNTEIETLRLLDHPNIIRVLHQGSVSDLVNGRLPAYMMALHRCSMEALVEAGWHNQAAEVAARRDVRSALTYCHALGVGHADVTPTNILVSNKIRGPDDEIQLELILIDAGSEGLDGIQ